MILKKGLFLVVLCLLLAGCASGNTDVKEQGADAENGKLQFPDKDAVLSVREKALQGMEEEDIDRLKNIIKTANQYLESLYIFQKLEARFSDSDSYYWRYLEQTGEFVCGYIYSDGKDEQGKASGLSKEEIEQQFGEPIYANNEYDAEKIVQLIDEIQGTIYDETFKQNFVNMADYVQKAKDTHDIEYILSIYYILHDMDYYLLRYGPEDVGRYVDDKSTIETYYGVLEDYKGTEY